MKSRWILLMVALLSLTMVLASCGKDPLVENPDTDIHTDEPGLNVPDSTPEDTTSPEETTAPAEEIKIPVIYGAAYVEFLDFAFEDLRFPPFEFDYEFDTYVEGEYYSVMYENPNPERYMAPEGGCITMVLSPGGGLARLQVEFSADMDPDYVIDAAMAAFYTDEDRLAVEKFMSDALLPEAPAQSKTVYNGSVFYLDKGFKGILPLYFYIEAEGVSEFMANHPIEEDAK